MSSIRDLKITPQQIAEKGVIASPDTLTGTPDENKSVFDRLASEIIVPAVNGAIEMLGDVEDDTLEWASDEAQRQANESARQSAEDARVQAEKGRVSAETGRVSAESSRASAESARGTAEDARVQAEKGRASAESGRVTAENGRVSAESARATAEQLRAQAEGEREDAEDARELAEQQRADETAGIVAQATAQAGEAADSATLSQSWARGGTGTRSGENTNNAKYFSEQAQASAAGASTSAGAAAGSASTAQSAASQAQTARGQAQTARDAAQTAASQAQGAKTDAEDAAQRAERAAEDAEAIAGGDFIPISQKGAASGVASLDASGKLEESQKPNYTASEVGADAAGSAAAVQTSLAAHTNDTNNPHNVTAAQIGAIPLSQKGAPGGVAELGADGKVAAGQIGAAGGSLLTITFDAALEGLPYTLAGGEESYSSIVPASLEAVHSLLGVDTPYTLTVTGSDDTYTRTIQTEEYFTALALSITPFAATITVTCPAGSSVTCANGDTTLTQTAASGTAVFTVGNAGTWTITATLDGESASGEVVISADGESKSITLQYVHIYGVLWDGTSTTALSRTNDAQDFTDPVPAVSNGNGSSPFDTLQPWAGMTRETDSAAGELVAIPKYWYKWTKSGNTIKLQIADKAVEGFLVSPAHCDRGDGQGERDVVYVGRYHCHTSNWKSQTGGKPKADITRSAARSGIHNLGGTIWQWDWAMNWTIKMLYLVEYADWNSQTKIGYGCGNNSSTENMGQTDGMTYHTGTKQSSRTTYGVGVQYRHIEGLWDNVYDWVDGCYYNGNGLNIILNPNNFSDSSGGTSIGTPSNGYPSALDIKTGLSNQWPLPTAASGSDSTYVPDNWYFSASNPCLHVGGNYSQGLDHGLFYVNCNAATDAVAYIGCRLMKLP